MIGALLPMYQSIMLHAIERGFSDCLHRLLQAKMLENLESRIK